MRYVVAARVNGGNPPCGRIPARFPRQLLSKTQTLRWFAFWVQSPAGGTGAANSGTVSGKLLCFRWGAASAHKLSIAGMQRKGIQRETQGFPWPPRRGLGNRCGRFPSDSLLPFSSRRKEVASRGERNCPPELLLLKPKPLLRFERGRFAGIMRVLPLRGDTRHSGE